MSAYGPLAHWYDALTRDVDYEAFADYYEAVFHRDGGEYVTLLDLCCGTGSLSCALARRGYELISVDASAEMLMEAREKTAKLSNCVPPLLICQRAGELDLYGTVDAALSSLDSLNYLSPQELTETLRRLRLFVRPGGLLIFDLRSPEFLNAMDGQVWVDETEDLLCLWRGRLDQKHRALRYGMDIFRRQGQGWSRESEEHIEYVHDPEWLKSGLEENGFSDIRILTDGPQGELGRVFYIAKRQEQ